MKRILQLCMLIAVLLMAFQHDAMAQSRGKKKKKQTKTDQYFDDSGGFSHRLWYGGGFNLNFGGGFGVSQFNIGVSPMVGYKITDNFSVGPRVSVLYTDLRVRDFNNRVYRAGLVDWSVAAFTRYKFLDFLFAHVEYGVERISFTDGTVSGDKLVTGTRQQDNFFIGAGYNSNSGGLWGFEISLLYNVLLPDNSPNTPFDIRFGVNYKF